MILLHIAFVLCGRIVAEYYLSCATRYTCTNHTSTPQQIISDNVHIEYLHGEAFFIVVADPLPVYISIRNLLGLNPLP